MNIDNFVVESSDIEFAQDICKTISSSDIRNRAVANALAAGVATKFFDNENYEIDSKSGLHNIGIVLEDIDIADIYVNKNYIDARIFFNENEIGVPEAHFSRNILPLAYMFVKINEDLSGANVVGFITPEQVDKSNLIDGTYYFSENSLQSFYDIELLINNIDDTEEVSDKDIFAYLDGSLEDKDSFYSQLLTSQESRIRLARAARAKEIFQFVSITKTEKVDSTLELQESDLEPEQLLEEHVNNDMELELCSSDDSDNIIDLQETSLDLEITGDEELGFMDIEAEENDESFGLNIQENFENNELDADIKIEQETEDFSEENIPDINTEENIENNDLESLDELFVAQEYDDVDLEENVNSTTEEPVNKSDDEDFVDQFDHSEESFDFSTIVSPSLDLETAEEELQIDESIIDDEQSDEQTEIENKEHIEALFNNDKDEEDESDFVETDNLEQTPKKNSVSTPLAIISTLIIAGAFGYFGYTKFASENSSADNNIQSTAITDNQPIETLKQTETAMPIESIETTSTQLIENEPVNNTIPVIEQNLDASIMVSNLKVDWEVPSGYVSNTSAKRYFIKLGKIIQLNLKTELMLLNKPPITNKIAVEIKFNDDSKKFEAIEVTVSSGEPDIDELILRTINKVLAMNLSVNTTSFAQIKGNPVLIINL